MAGTRRNLDALGTFLALSRLMKLIIILPMLAVLCAGGRAAELSPAPVFQDDIHQFTGVALSKSGRMFVNYPRWQSAHQYDVVEVMSNGTVHAYPNDEWNSWHEGLSGSNKWICVQAVYVDDSDELWVVDPGAPQMEKVQADGAKLVGIDLKSNEVKHLYNLTQIVGRNSYLNDVRVDTSTRTAYLTESKKGGIVVVNLQSGESRLVLNTHYSVKSDPNHALTVNGEELKRNGKPFKGNSDGIALSPDRQWLYFKPLSDTKLYRVRTEDLRNPSLSRKELNSKVEDLGSNFTTSDGMIFDQKGNLYLSDNEHDTIVRITPAMKMETIARDHRLIWPDTFSWSTDGWLYVTCSQIQNMPWCHDGRSTRTTPYSIYRLKPQ
jgi:sugar lactone lactonase YvrE